MSKVTEAISRCPFCGEDDRLVVNAYGIEGNNETPEDRAHEVVCDGCGASGPERAPRLTAIAAWNRRAALEAASSTPDGEAVAWRWQSLEADAATPFWFDRMTGGRPEPSEFVRNVTPLYAHPNPISKGVTVKALEWGSERRYGFLIHEGRGAGYTYEAAAKAYGPGWIVTLGLTTIFDGPDADEAAAKAAAQADFDARILSCLSHNAGEIEAGGEVDGPADWSVLFSEAVAAYGGVRSTARLINVSPSTVSRLARGEAPDPKTAKIVGAAIGQCPCCNQLWPARAALKVSRL